jgi:F-type H+-transporting ATPase subunit a
MLLLPLAESSADADAGGGFHAPSIVEFFPPYIVPWGAEYGDPVPFYALDRLMLVRIVMTIALITLFAYLTRRARVVPGRRQNLGELALDFVRVQVVEQVMGKKGTPYVPMVSVLFFSIFAMNIAGIIPLLNIPGTARVGYPLVCALWVYVTYLVVGARTHGVGPYLKNSLLPPGVPWIMYVLITPIEFLQVFLFRPLTLALRLLANMIAGHLMLVLCFSASSFLLLEGGGLIKAAGLLTAVAGLGITLFEMLVAVLQAYIFALLAAVYLNMALEEEH